MATEPTGSLTNRIDDIIRELAVQGVIPNEDLSNRVNTLFLDLRQQIGQDAAFIRDLLQDRKDNEEMREKAQQTIDGLRRRLSEHSSASQQPDQIPTAQPNSQNSVGLGGRLVAALIHPITVATAAAATVGGLVYAARDHLPSIATMASTAARVVATAGRILASVPTPVYAAIAAGATVGIGIYRWLSSYMKPQLSS
jgi:hypothetical protein